MFMSMECFTCDSFISDSNELTSQSHVSKLAKECFWFGVLTFLH